MPQTQPKFVRCGCASCSRIVATDEPAEELKTALQQRSCIIHWNNFESKVVPTKARWTESHKKMEQNSTDSTYKLMMVFYSDAFWIRSSLLTLDQHGELSQGQWLGNVAMLHHFAGSHLPLHARDMLRQHNKSACEPRSHTWAQHAQKPVP